MFLKSVGSQRSHHDILQIHAVGGADCETAVSGADCETACPFLTSK